MLIQLLVEWVVIVKGLSQRPCQSCCPLLTPLPHPPPPPLRGVASYSVHPFKCAPRREEEEPEHILLYSFVLVDDVVVVVGVGVTCEESV